MSRHHELDKITLPVGFTEKDMDWMATSWELMGYDKDLERYLMKQYVMFPGVVVERTGDPWKGSFLSGRELKDYYVVETSAEFGSACDFALVITHSLLRNAGWRCVRYPFVVDFTESDLHSSIRHSIDSHDGAVVSTLGDIVDHFETQPSLSLAVFDKIAHVRSTISEIVEG